MAIDSEAFLDQTPPPANDRVQYGSDPSQFADIRLPVSGKTWPVLMNIHGGFWRSKHDLSHAGHFCFALTEAGIATANVEYRRVGNPGGGWPGSFEDVRSAYKYLLEHATEMGFDERRILVAGHSAGAHLAFCLAAYESSVRNAISLGGVLDLRQAYDFHLSNDAVANFLGGTPEEISGRYREASPLELKIAARQVVVTGTSDDVVPGEISRSYAQAKRNAGEEIKFVEIPDGDHFDLIDPRTKGFKVVLDSIQRLLT
jgi:acetyl esterase/lipase